MVDLNKYNFFLVTLGHQDQEVNIICACSLITLIYSLKINSDSKYTYISIVFALDMDSPSPILIGEVTSTSSPYFSDNSSHRLTGTDPILDEADILYDPHSSEEELEVINNISGGGSHSNSSSRVTTTLDSPLLPVPSLTGGASTKRKW